MNANRARLLAASAVTVALLVPLAVFGGSALARSTSAASEYQYSSTTQYQSRVTICHLTGSKKHPGHTITISSAAVRAHLKHGDHLGACTGTETRTSHGNSNGNGNDQNENETENENENGQGHGHGHGK
jgi:hypothetical protein